MQGLVPQTGRFEALSHAAGKVWVCKRPNCRPSEELQEVPREQLFEDSIQSWDKRRNKSTPQHPDFRQKKSKIAVWLDKRHKAAWVDSHVARWDSGRKKVSEPVSPSIQGQGDFAAHEGHLKVGLCKKLCEEGRVYDAVDALNLLVQRGRHVGNNLFYVFLKWCISHRDLALGRRIHSLSVKCGYEGDAFLATHLIGMYASHGRLEEAMRVFTTVSTPDVFNWATIIFAYARHGVAGEAIRLYQQMRESTLIVPDNRIYVAVLKACAAAEDLVAGKEVHAHILASPEKPDVFVHNSLVNMYAKCRSLEDARRVFDEIPNRNVVIWTAMIAGYAQQGMGQEAMSLYSSMQQEGLTPPDSVTYVCLLQVCAGIGVGTLHEVKHLHAQIKERGLQDDVALGGSLVNAYAKCGSLEGARKVFDRLPARNVVAWNAILAGYAQQGMGQEALTLYSRMQQEGMSRPDYVTYVCLLQACANGGVEALLQGKQLHAEIQENGLKEDVVLGGSLVNMYAKCGSLEDARRVFDRLPARDVVTWTAMIAGYVEQGLGYEALSLHSSMQLEGLTSPNSVTYVCLLQACAIAGVAALHEGKQLHQQIKEQGLQDDMILGGSLVNMYTKCGSLEDARNVFNILSARNVVAWNAILAGYAQQGMGEEALNLYRIMQQEGLAPDSVTYVCLLQACASLGGGAIRQGKQLDVQINERGLQDDVVLGGSLVNMYAKCGSLQDACRVFNNLPSKNVVTWTAMIAGYAQHGMSEEALGLYRSMELEGLTPNSVTYASLLQACAAVAALPLGKQLHAEIEARGIQGDVVVGAALVNLYAKCGSISDSQQVFDSLPERSVEAWGALISGYAHQGDSDVVFDLLDRMRLEGMHPDAITFLSVLTVCSHLGLVDKAREWFDVMLTDYGITATAEHFTCMLDILGRAGHVDDAFQMAKTMPFPAKDIVWHTLLGACQKWRNVEIGRQAFEAAVSVDETDDAAYVLMSNIYASAEMWDAATEMQARRKKLGARKRPGQSWWTDMGGVVHTFVAGDKKHPESESIYARLEQLVPN